MLTTFKRLQLWLKVRTLIGCLALSASLLAGPARGQGTTAQTIGWTGTTDAILALNTAHLLSATASSGLPVMLRVDAGPAIIANGMITVTALGTVVVTAEQAGDATYASARETRSFNVRQAVLSRVGGYASLDTSRVKVAGNYAYVLADRGFYVIDVGNPASPTLVGKYYDASGSVSDLQVVGNLAYVTDYGIWNGSKFVGGGVRVIDVSNPASPMRVSEYNTTGRALGVQVAKNYAYIADYGAGLQVIDVTDPINPVRVGSYDTSGNALEVRVVENYAYVADEGSGLQVIDVSNPARPVRLGGYDTSGIAVGVQVLGNYAYVTDWEGGLQVIDVSNPVSLVRVGGGDAGGAAGVQVSGNYAYVADTGPVEGEGSGLRVFDVSNPASPLLVGAVYTDSAAWGVQVVGNYAYVANGGLGLQIFELKLRYPQTVTWTGMTNEILALNVAYPLSPTASSGLPVTLRVTSGSAVLANGAITVTGVGTVMVTAEQAGDATYLPVSETRSFNVRQALLTPVGGYATDVETRGVNVAGNFAYVTDWDGGLQVLDVSNPASPVRVGLYSGLDAYDLRVVGNYAYVADGGLGLQIIDVSDPVSPSSVGGIDTGGSAQGVQMMGKYAYVADGDSGLQIIDVIQPANPVRVGGYDSGTGASDVQVVGNYVYLAAKDLGLQIIDVSDPTKPVLVGVADGIGSARSIEVVGNYAYVGTTTGNPFNPVRRLQVVEISKPANPKHLGGVSASSGAFDMQENYAFIASGSLGLQVMDVSNPANPVSVPLAGYDLGISARSVQVVKNHAYVATESGLQILELKLGYPNTLEFNPPTEVAITNSFLALPPTSSSGAAVTYAVSSGPARVEADRLIFTGPGWYGCRLSSWATNSISLCIRNGPST